MNDANSMQILNIAGYQFSHLADLENLRLQLQDSCAQLQLKGTILLSEEGINISLAGTPESINSFKIYLQNNTSFRINFHETWSQQIPFQHLKVKIKNEIITFGQPNIDASKRAPHLAPLEFKQWLDEKRDITILDTRNDYEVRFGTFDNALNLHIDDFGELPATLDKISKEKPIVMFCTGGIRCEKAAIYLENNGYSNVYQLDGGILGYFAKVGGEHYDGECFIFDERISLNPQLQTTGTTQCIKCQGPVSKEHSNCPQCK